MILHIGQGHSRGEGGGGARAGRSMSSCAVALLTVAHVAVGFLAPFGVAAQDGLSWEPCEDRPETECVLLDVPIDHDDAAGPTMSVGLRRVLGGGEGARQLWYLAGGPGDAVGGALENIAAVLGDADLDVYGIDHRGTGASARLECPDQQAAGSPDGGEITSEEWSDCIAHIEDARTDLEFLTVTQSAHDLAWAIEAVTGRTTAREVANSEDGPAVFILGASYGSFWANRYLHLYPEQPTGVILDGIVPADWSFAEFDGSLDAVAREWLRRCAADAECGRALGEVPAAFVSSVIDRLDDGHCPDIGIDGSMARLLFGVVIMVDEIPQAMIPAMAWRWARCEWSDVMALMHFVRVVLGSVGEGPSHAPVLQRHVALSEIWDANDPPADELEAALGETVATTEVSASFGATWPAWPRYESDLLDGLQADYAGPMLLLHGGLDPTMPVNRLDDVRNHYAGEGQTFLVLPEAGHVTLNFGECPRALYRAFLNDPASPVDASCVEEADEPTLAVDEATSQALFGTTDFWGDHTPIASTLWFKFRYRWLPFIAGVLALFVLGRAVGGEQATVGRRSIAVAAWLVITFVAYVFVASTPLLLDYRAPIATASAFAIGGVQYLLIHATARLLGGPSPKNESPAVT